MTHIKTPRQASHQSQLAFSHPLITMSLRPYNDKTDRAEIIEMCRTVWNGTDYIPRLLPTLPTYPNTHAFVLPGTKTSIDSFVYVYSLGLDIKTKKNTYFMGGLRVEPSVRNQGLGKRTISLIGRHMKDVLRGGKVLSTTIRENEVVVRIFEKLGWSFVEQMAIWPPDSCVKTRNGSVLKRFGLAGMDGTKGERRAALEWEECEDEKGVEDVTRSLSDDGDQMLVPMFFKVATAKTVAQDYMREKMVWIGKCDHVVRALLVVSKDPVLSEPSTIVSICTRSPKLLHDVLCFVENDLGLDQYRTVFNGKNCDANALETIPGLDFKKHKPDYYVVYQKCL